MNNKGFTLIELLAVIVILAVVMLIAVTAVGPMMAKSRKSALGTEGLSLIDAAKTAYAAEISKGANAAFKSTSSVCFSLDYLNSLGYFGKNADDGYSGSIAVKYNSVSKSYTYLYWITNGTYMFIANDDSSVDPADAFEYASDVKTQISKCSPTSYTSGAQKQSAPSVGGEEAQLQASSAAETSEYDVICDQDGCTSTSINFD